MKTYHELTHEQRRVAKRVAFVKVVEAALERSDEVFPPELQQEVRRAQQEITALRTPWFLEEAILENPKLAWFLLRMAVAVAWDAHYPGPRDLTLRIPMGE